MKELHPFVFSHDHVSGKIHAVDFELDELNIKAYDQTSPIDRPCLHIVGFLITSQLRDPGVFSGLIFPTMIGNELSGEQRMNFAANIAGVQWFGHSTKYESDELQGIAIRSRIPIPPHDITPAGLFHNHFEENGEGLTTRALFRA